MGQENFGFLEFLLNFLIGAILGGAFGFYTYVELAPWDLYYSHLAAILFIGGGAVTGGVLLALYKGHRGFW